MLISFWKIIKSHIICLSTWIHLCVYEPMKEALEGNGNDSVEIYFHVKKNDGIKYAFICYLSLFHRCRVFRIFIYGKVLLPVAKWWNVLHMFISFIFCKKKSKIHADIMSRFLPEWLLLLWWWLWYKTHVILHSAFFSFLVASFWG